jgi:4-amino-4-deoxy-L-arabinose transferase-like glycosyltransferase
MTKWTFVPKARTSILTRPSSAAIPAEAEALMGRSLAETSEAVLASKKNSSLHMGPPMLSSFAATISEKREWLSNLFIILVIGVVMLNVAWVGYVGSDDHSYARGALGWLDQFPYVGKNHWTLRHTVVIPVAVSLAVFGMREISLGLPSALLFLLILGFNYHYLQRFLSARFALLASALMATTPLFVVQATFPQDIIAQLFVVSLSFWSFYSAAHCERPGWLMFAAGVAAAFGWLTIETTAALLLFYGFLFLIGFGVPRRYYWIMALGFVLFVVMEVGYFTAMTGDPLYRYRIDLFHDVVDRVGDAKAAISFGMLLNLEGNLTVSPFLEPFVALLVNQEFGLLFWAYIPAAVWAWRTKEISMEDQRLLRLLIGLGLFWMAFVSLNASVLYVVPRYYAPFSWTAVIIVAYWLKQFLFVRRPRLALVAGVGLLGANLLCVYVENKNPLFAERALVEYVSRYPGIVYTDPMTADRARLLLDFSGSRNRVSGNLPPPGAVFYANMKNIERCKHNGDKCRWSWEQYVRRDGWLELARIEPRRKLSGILLRLFKLDTIIPRDIFDRLDKPNPGGTLYLTSR